MKKAAFALLLAAAAFPATATMLYKSVSPNGTIMFSDVPPADGARVVEQRALASGSLASAPTSSALAGSLDQWLDGDGAIARASAQVDLAEHALALARRDLRTPREGLTLATRRMTLADQDRIEFYKKDLRIARQALMDLLRERRHAPPPEPGAPRIVASR